jgi:hypothetical protein
MGALDVAVYHSYNQIHPTPPRILYLNESIPSGSLDKQHGATPGGTGWQGKAMSGFAKEAGGVPLWLGEFGPHNGGGGGEYASTFVSSFGYIDTLGTLARLNHSVLARQTLVGGNYELLRCSSGQDKGPEPGTGCDFEPHPDYWVALMWKRMMGAAVLPAPSITLPPVAALRTVPSSSPAPSSLESLRMHAHCTAGSTNGSVTVAFSNMDEAISYTLNLGDSYGAQRRAEYHMTPGDDEGINTRRLLLNNATVLAVGDKTELPELPGLVVPAGSSGAISVAPVSMGFVVFLDAKAPACM